MKKILVSKKNIFVWSYAYSQKPKKLKIVKFSYFFNVTKFWKIEFYDIWATINNYNDQSLTLQIHKHNWIYKTISLFLFKFGGANAFLNYRKLFGEPIK